MTTQSQPEPVAVTDSPSSHDGLHHAESTMESGSYNCFHRERSMR